MESTSAAPIVFDFSAVAIPAAAPEVEQIHSGGDENDENPADEVAKKLIALLVGAFKAKEGRDPTPEEAEELMNELTEERITALLNGTEEEVEEGEGEGEEESDEEGDEEGEGAEGNEEEVAGGAKGLVEAIKSPVKEVDADENIVGQKRDAAAAELTAEM